MYAHKYFNSIYLRNLWHIDWLQISRKIYKNCLYCFGKKFKLWLQVENTFTYNLMCYSWNPMTFFIAWKLRDEQGCWLELLFCSFCSLGSKSEMECLYYLFIHLFLQHLLLMRRLMMTNDFTCSEDDAQTFHAYLDISNDTN